MGAAYSHDLRERVMAAVDGGLGVYSAAPMFRVSVSSMYKALGRRRATGAVTAHKSGGGPKPKLAAYDEALRAQVAQKADITLVELQAWLANDRAVKVSVGCVGAGPSSWVDAQKKSQRAAEQDRPDLAQARQQWRAQQAEWRAHNLVFVDETGASTKMTRLDRRCPCGERLVSPVPWGHWKTTTFIGAQRQNGLVAPCAFDGPINGEKFRAWVEQFLVPELKPGDIVVLDNLSSHKVAGVRTAIESAKARLLYLPPYSPDLNPIEQGFAKLKPCCARPRREPSTPSSTPSPARSKPSRPTNAQTISQTQAIHTNKEKCFRGVSLIGFSPTEL
jgi:transposase